MSASDVAIVIPARFASTRFPGKPLADLHGEPMVVRVAQQCVDVARTIVATDDDRIARVARAAGLEVAMTSSGCATGTDRLAEAAQQIDAQLIINVQGDEPLIQPQSIELVIDAARQQPDAVINACTPVDAGEADNPNVPKVVFADDGRLLYASRTGIPATKTGHAPDGNYWRQVCIYAFRQQHLQRFANTGGKTRLEALEDIEILRFLELGIDVRLVETPDVGPAVDTPEDLERVRQLMAHDQH